MPSRDFVDALVQLIPPPKRPIDVDDPAAWERMTSKLGTPLPADYRAIVEIYGAGTFDGFIHVATIGPLYPAVRLDGLLDACQTSWRMLSGVMDLGYEIFPRANGLLPCGVTDNGDYLYWRTGGDPDAWTIAVKETRGGDPVEDFSMGLAEFLYPTISGIVRCNAFEGNVPTGRHSFEQEKLGHPASGS